MELSTVVRSARRRDRSTYVAGVGAPCLEATVGVVTAILDILAAGTGHAAGAMRKIQNVCFRSLVSWVYVYLVNTISV